MPIRGGVGKTTLVHQIIAKLPLKTRALLIDNDQQENLSEMYVDKIVTKAMKGDGCEVLTVRGLLAGQCEATRINPDVSLIFYDYLTTAETASLAEVDSPGSRNVAKKLCDLSNQFDIILIDCNPAHMALTKVLIQICPRMMYVCEINEFSMTGMVETMDIRKMPVVVIINKVILKEMVLFKRIFKTGTMISLQILICLDRSLII
jgi:cellulose biosynthesis protein BcsQ